MSERDARRAADWPISEVAAMSGTTSRTLRHYDALGLLTPARLGENGYRYYDRDGLVRLQRILLLRQLGLGLPAIAEVLAREADVASVLAEHVEWLRGEQERLARQLDSVTRTLEAIRRGKDLDMAEMFDGFDHSRHQDEAAQRWGADGVARSNRWWEAKTPAERKESRARWPSARAPGRSWPRPGPPPRAPRRRPSPARTWSG